MKLLLVVGVVALLGTLFPGTLINAQNHNGPIRFTTVGGTYYSVGYQVGSAMADLITDRLSFDDYQTLYPWLKNNSDAQFVNASLFNATQRAYPELIEEIQGVADGADLPFDHIWMMNIVDELYEFQRFGLSVKELRQGRVVPIDPSFAPNPMHGVRHRLAQGKNGAANQKINPALTQCTDVFTNEGPTPAWGHNEDSGIYDQNHTYMVKARIYSNDSTDGVLLEEFVAYTYAGSVAGKAFMWNSHGLLFSCNALFPKMPNFIDPFALPRQIHNRVVLRSASVDQAIQYTTALPSVCGFSLNIGYRSSNMSKSRSIPFEYATYRNVEVWPMGGRAVTDIFPRNNFTISPPPGFLDAVPQEPHHFFHANDYEVLNVPYIVDGSSVDRMQRLNEMPVPYNISMVRTMLGDTENPVHPIYRHGTEGGYTLASVLYDFAEDTIYVYNSNPKNTTHFFEFPMRLSQDWE
jgi:hypothetical protein